MKYFFSLFFILTVIVSSNNNKIETASSLKQKDYQLFTSLNLFDKDEKLQKFYSEFKKQVAGNFYTDKRIASYWLDDNDKQKNKIEFAFYKDITKIDTIYNAGLTYCPYLLVTRLDSSNFKVCVEGTRNEIADFFNGAIETWNKSKK